MDHPGVPAVVLIDGNQMELRMEGESLGRWSLVDVRAERLVSNAFSLALGNEEVTFLADDPIDFAYRGVEHMAKTWAKYRSMTLPRRMVANSRSRKGTEASRIEDLRSAMKDNLIGAALTAIPSQRETARPTPLPGSLPASTTPPANRAEPTPTPSEDVPPEAESMDPPLPSTFTPARAPTSSMPAAEERTEPAQADPAPDIDSSVPESEEQPVPEPEVAPAAKAKSDSVFKETVPWARAKEQPAPETLLDESQTAGSNHTEQPQEVEESEPPAEIPVFEPKAVASPTEARLDDVISEPEAGQIDSEESLVSEADDAPAPWIDPTALSDPEPAPEPSMTADPAVEDEERLAAAEAISEIQSQLDTDQFESEQPAQSEPVPEPEPAPTFAEDNATPKKTVPKREFVVDLAAFEDPDSPSGGDADRAKQPEPEPAMAGADRSGIMGAVKAAFVRGRSQHEHEYVEAPGGMGIVRHICTDCGHISIGVSE